jgi:hypothetical protein
MLMSNLKHFDLSLTLSFQGEGISLLVLFNPLSLRERAGERDVLNLLWKKPC